MMHVEIFTGARAVDATDASREWARAIVRDVLATLPPDALIVCGDAAGVDRIVRSEVMRLGLRGEEYALDGNVYAVTPARDVLSQWARGDEVPRSNTDQRWHSWPLRRNDAMRDRVSRERVLGATAHGSALLWGESRGTIYTADACARVGIVVTRYEPAEAGQ